MNVFNPNIPQSNDDPTASQSDLLGNFGKLNTDWAVNHIPLTAGGNNGFHTKIQFPAMLTLDPTTTGLESAVYPKAGPDALPALFFKNSSAVYQLTKLPVVSSGTNRGIVTPWGFTINAGSIASGVTTATFAIPYTMGQFYTALLTAQGVGIPANYRIVTITNTQLTISTTQNSAFYYLVMGV